MDYKKMYEEALERAKYLKENTDSVNAKDISYTFEYIFPELSGSEDERIRKAIGYAIGQSAHSDGTLTNGITSKEALAWLEKQGEQKSAWNKEDNKNLNSVEWIIENSENLNEVFETIDSPEYIKKYFIDWLKSLKYRFQPKPKQEWSEEDERMLGKCIDAASGYYSPEDKQSIKDWLESLKDRVQLQPKQEWSEEDKEMLYNCLGLIQEIDCTQEEQNWLKSLIKPQNRWKPSEQNIKDLEWCADLVKDKMGVGFHRLQVFIDELKNNK